MDKKPRYLYPRNGRWFFEPRGQAREYFGFPSKPLGADEAEARRIATQLNQDWDNHRKGEEEAPEVAAGTLAGLIDAFREDPVWYLQKPARYRAEMDRHLDAIKEEKGLARVAALRRKHIKKFYNDLLAKTSPAIARERLKYLTRVLTYAMDELEIIDHNPAARISRVKEPPRRTVWEEEEVQAVIKTLQESGRTIRKDGYPMPYEAHPEVALAVAIAYDTTLDQQDTLALQWAAWDGEGFLVEQQKERGTVRVYCPVSPETRAMIEAAHESRKSPYVITDGSGRPYVDPPGLKHRRRPASFGRIFRKACERAGVKDKTFHDLRRTGLTEYGNTGATETQLSGIGGHAIGSKVIDVYVMPDKESAKAAAAKRWNRKK